MPRESRVIPASLNSLRQCEVLHKLNVHITILTTTDLNFFTSVEVGLASRLISASELKCTQLATASITDSTVEGFIKLGVPTNNL